MDLEKQQQQITLQTLWFISLKILRKAIHNKAFDIIDHNISLYKIALNDAKPDVIHFKSKHKPWGKELKLNLCKNIHYR